MGARAAIASTISRALTSRTLRDLRRSIGGASRRVRGAQPTIEYFHDVRDPYSHLAAQALGALAERYAVELRPVLVPPPRDAAAPERARLAAWSARDAANVAARLGLDAPSFAADLGDRAARAESAMAQAIADGTFAARAPAIGRAAWTGDDAALAGFAAAPPDAVARALAEGDTLRTKRGHYLGATFHFEGEWYWGVDRLHYLESRLRGAGLAKPGAPDGFVAPPGELAFAAKPPPGAPRPTLDLFFSLRSPYSFIVIPRARRLARHYGAELRLRYILPMVMRGLPVPRDKSLYILRDTKREADRVNLSFGRVVDPRGKATEMGLAVLHAACAAGVGEDFALAFMRAVWADGVDGTSRENLDLIAGQAGLTRAFVSAALADESWRATAEANRAALFDLGFWGAPTLRVNDRPAHWGRTGFGSSNATSSTRRERGHDRSRRPEGRTRLALYAEDARGPALSPHSI